MRAKLDENLPLRLAATLDGLGHDVQSVYSAGLGGVTDKRVWTVAQDEGRFLITQDLDFSDIRRFRPGSHEGIMLVRLKRPGRKALFGKVSEVFQTNDVSVWRRCFVVVTDSKVRVHAPKP